MAVPHPGSWTDTSVAISRLKDGRARVRPSGWRMSSLQREHLAECLPKNPTPTLTLAIDRAIDAYRMDGMKQGVYSSYRQQKRPVYIERIKAAYLLFQHLDPAHDRPLINALHRSVTLWNKMAELIPPNPRNRPIDAAMIALGVATFRALDHEGIPLTLARLNTVSMEVLNFVRHCAEPFLPPLTPAGTYAFARKVLASYHRLQK
jgi:hypothetical protein